MLKLTERILLLGFLANLYKDEPKWGDDAAKVRKITPKVSKSEPKGAKSEPIGAKRSPKGCQREPKGSKRDPKGSKREPTGAKGSQKGAKREPKFTGQLGVAEFGPCAPKLGPNIRKDSE